MEIYDRKARIDKKWYDVGQDPEQGNLKEKSQ